MAGSTVMISSVFKLFSSSRSSLSRIVGPLSYQQFPYSKDVIPPAPKRPASPFFLYFKDVLPSMRKKNPDTKMKSLMKEIGENWKQLQPERQQKYRDEFQAARDKYVEVEEKWQKSLTDDQKIQLEEIKENEKMKKEIRKERLLKVKRRNELQKLGKPKRPLNAYFLFTEEFVATMENSKDLKATAVKKRSGLFSWLTKRSDTSNSQQTSNDLAKSVAKMSAEKWKSLTDNQKLPYFERSRKNMEHYKVQLENWKNQMLQEGLQVTTTTPTTKKGKK